MKITNFYSNKDPIPGTIVFIKSAQHKMKSDNGVYVEMIGYNNEAGFIPCTEINRWKVNLDTFFKQDKLYPCVILRKTDAIANKYDLSYIKVRKIDITILEDAFSFKSKIINIIEKLSEDLHLTENEHNKLCDNTIYKLLTPHQFEDVIISKKNIIKELYEKIILNPHILFQDSIYTEDELTLFINTIKKRIKIKPMTMIKEFTLTVIEDNSLVKLKNIFSSIEDKIECKSSPKYIIKLDGINKEILEKNINEICDKINAITQDYNVLLDLSSNIEIIKQIELFFM